MRRHVLPLSSLLPLPLLLCAHLCARAEPPPPFTLLTAHDPPHNMLADTRVIGLSTEQVEEMFRRTALPYTLRHTPWPRAYQSALELAGHCAFSMARSHDREDKFRWIGPIAQMDWVLYARVDGRRAPESLAEVRDAHIGGAAQDVITQWLVLNKFHVDPTPTDSLNPAKLQAGRFDYWAVSRQRGATITAAAGLTGRIAPVLTFGHSDLFLGCHRDTPDELVRKLSQALSEMRIDGTVDRILARYARWMPDGPAP